MTDVQIIESIRNGNRKSLEICYNKYFPTIKKMVLRNSGDEDDAQDVFQESFVVFYNNIVKETFELTSSISTYLYGIGKRIWLRKLQKHKAFMDISDHEDAQAEELDFELAGYSQNELVKKVVDLMSGQGKNCKDILLLSYFEMLDNQHIAQRLGYNSEQVVREKKYRCLKNLRNTIQDKYGETLLNNFSL